VNFQAGLTCRDNDGIDVHGLLRERERERERKKEEGGGHAKFSEPSPNIY
jgi:hypothetical protein